jgi:hypothetical protein
MLAALWPEPNSEIGWNKQHQVVGVDLPLANPIAV